MFCRSTLQSRAWYGESHLPTLHRDGIIWAQAVILHPRTTDNQEDRNITRIAIQNPYLMYNRIAVEVNLFCNTPVSSQAVRHWLCKCYLCKSKPAQISIFTTEHQRQCLSFANNHAQFLEGHWKRVFFMDDFIFSPMGSDQQASLWRHHGQQYAQCYVVQRSNFISDWIIVWSGISHYTRIDLNFFTLALEMLRCIYYIGYSSKLCRALHAICGCWLLIHARWCVFTCGTKCVEIAWLEWPNCSPDLNPTEHVWTG